MGMNIEPMIKLLKEQRDNHLKDELKANRKKDGEWERVLCYPGPMSQVVAMRDIAPRGYQRKWLNGTIDTYIPTKEGFQLRNKRGISVKDMMKNELDKEIIM